jgi:hypothetical protein
MHNTPIGPTGAAIQKPMKKPQNKKVISIKLPGSISHQMCEPAGFAQPP